MDVYENKGKRSGAYNMGTYLSAPYVLLNYKNTFHDVSTLAHELGHILHRDILISSIAATIAAAREVGAAVAECVRRTSARAA